VSILRVIFPDQLSASISSLKDCDLHTDVVMMAEVDEEATYVKHHKKKLVFVLSAMRHFGLELKKKGYLVDYISLSDSKQYDSMTDALASVLRKRTVEKIVVTEPGEYRMQVMVDAWSKKFGVVVEIREDDRFLCSRDMFKQWAKGRKNIQLEMFYRHMRKQVGVMAGRNQ
jgi:deoxyribodipyrimidine photolyase-related protein